MEPLRGRSKVRCRKLAGTARDGVSGCEEAPLGAAAGVGAAVGVVMAVVATSAVADEAAVVAGGAAIAPAELPVAVAAWWAAKSAATSASR